MRGKFLIIVLALVVSVTWAQGSTNQARTVVGGSFTLAAGERLAANLTAIGAEVTLAAGSRLEGHVTSIGGRLVIYGAVTEDVHAYGGEVVLGDEAQVAGALSTNWASLERAPTAAVGQLQPGSTRAIHFRLPALTQETVELYTLAAQPDTPVGILPRSLALALVSALLMLLAPRPLKHVGETMAQQPLQAAAAGLTVAITATVLLALLAITIIGIPLALLGAILFVAAVLFGWVALGAYFGRRFDAYVGQNWPETVQVTVGTFALAFVVLSLDYVPVLGGFVQVALSLLALGALALTRFGTRGFQTSPAAPHLPPSPRSAVKGPS